MKALRSFEKHEIVSFMITFVIFYLYSEVFFQFFPLSIGLAFFVSLRFYKFFDSIYTKREMNKNIEVFREFLDIFSANIQAGQNLYYSLKNTDQELAYFFSGGTRVTQALKECCGAMDSGQSQQEALLDFAEKVQIKEAKVFVDTLLIAIESGISIKEITKNTKDALSEQIEIELEVGNHIDSSKREFIIMVILPIVILLALKFTNESSIGLIDYLVRVPVYLMILFAFDLGQRIVHMEV